MQDRKLTNGGARVGAGDNTSINFSSQSGYVVYIYTCCIIVGFSYLDVDSSEGTAQASFLLRTKPFFPLNSSVSVLHFVKDDSVSLTETQRQSHSQRWEHLR